MSTLDQATRHGLIDGRNGRPNTDWFKDAVPNVFQREYVRAYNEGASEQGFASIVSRTLRPTPGACAEYDGAHFMSWERDRFDSTDPEDALGMNLPHDA